MYTVCRYRADPLLTLTFMLSGRVLYLYIQLGGNLAQSGS
jgi:hypothetical protein